MSRPFLEMKRPCPLCRSVKRIRTMRPRRWKLLPLGRCYICRECGTVYLSLFGLFSLPIERGFI